MIFSLLLFISHILSQDWQSFHYQDQKRFEAFQINSLNIDERAKTFNPINNNRNNLSHEVIGYLPYWEYDEYPDLNYNLLTQINFFSAELSDYGDIINNHNWENLYFIEFAQSQGVKVKLCATLFGQESLTTLLSNYFNRQNAINNLLDLVVNAGADGIDIDFELVPASQRENLVLFMQELSFAFHNELDDPIITMATPAIDWSNAWDYESLAAITDGLFIMGYNYFYSGSSIAGPVAPLGGYFYDIEYTVNDYLDKTNNQTDKLILGLPYYGYDWPVINDFINSETTGYGTARTYAEARNLSQFHENFWHDISNSSWFTYLNNQWRQTWYDDSLSLSFKYQFAKEKDLQGIGIWALGYDDNYNELWDVLENHFASYQIGDVNFDQDINIQDVIVVVSHIINSESYTVNADLNNDGYIDILDILILINIVLDN